MKRNWLYSALAMLLAISPAALISQEPAVEIFRPAQGAVTPAAISPAAELRYAAAEELQTLAWGPAEPGSPSDSMNHPAQGAALTLGTPAPAQDEFGARIARLEAQVAELSRQLKSGAAAGPVVYAARSVPAMAAWRTESAPAAISRNLLRATTIPPAQATTTIAPGAPVVIHVYVSPAPGAAATPAPATYYYSVTPPTVATPVPARVRMAVPRTPAAPAVTPGAPGVMNLRVAPLAVDPTAGTPAGTLFLTPAIPAAPIPPSGPSAPALPAAPALPSAPGFPATPASPTAPAAPPGVSSPATTAPASRIAWDDVPGEE